MCVRCKVLLLLATFLFVSSSEVNAKQKWEKMHDHAFNAIGKENNVKLLKRFLYDQSSGTGNPISINQKDERERTLLHWAAARGHIELTDLLLAQSGIDINVKDKKGWTPLHLASYMGYTSVMISLLKSGAHLNVKTNDPLTPLHLAVLAGRLKAVQLLLTRTAIDTAKKGGGDGQSLIHLAVSWLNANDSSVLVYLLAQDAIPDIDIEDDGGRTALFAASETDAIAIIDVLIQRGARVNVRRKRDGRSPLHIASFFDCRATIKKLLSQPDGDINIQDQQGCTPLHCALEGCRQEPETIELLLSYPEIDINSQDKEGHTPLYYAQAMKPLQKGIKKIIVEMLLEHSAKNK